MADAARTDIRTAGESRLQAPGLPSAAAARHAGIESRVLITAVLVCVGYYVGAKFGFALTFHPRPISTLWPPNSLLLAALLLTPARWWWLLVLAAFPAHLAAQLQSGVPAAMVMGWFVSNCSEALIGAVCVRRFVSGPLRFDSFRHVGTFLLFGVLVGPLLSSFLDAGLVKLIGWGEGSYWHLWRMRFLSNALAALTLVPLVVTWAQGGIASLRTASALRAAEFGLLLLGLLATGILVFAQKGVGTTTTPALFYVPLPFLLWAAVRLGPRGTSAALFVVVMLAIWGAIRGQGPFATSSPEENARAVQLFLIAVAVPLLLLSAVLEERGKAREALEQSEKRSVQIFRSSPFPIAIVRQSDQTIVDVNDRWEAMFGITRPEAFGRTTADLHVYVNDSERRAFLDALSAHGVVWDKEADVRDSAGRVRHAVLSADTAIIGGEACIITIVRDITERRRAEREAEEQRQQLTHLSRVAMLGELSGALAHELNQPLTAILSNAQAAQHLLASERIDPGELREILRDIADEDRRAGAVIGRLRALFKKGETHFQPLDVNELVNDVLHLASGDLASRSIESVMHLTTELPPVRGDRIQLQQVLLNLVMNACEAMDASGSGERTLIIRTGRAEDGSVLVSVSDSGPGVPADRVDRLFEPFFTTKQKGLGLGLSISRSIVSAHGARLWAENNPDHGATFHLALPATGDARL
jgi:PAS domain S-box-containing protein